jgi:hypothetical protein
MIARFLFVFLFASTLYGQIPSLVYGPYLQMGAQTSMIICWRTDLSCDSRVQWGSTKTNLNNIIQTANTATQHSVTVAGLAPNTKYWYKISNSSNTFLCDTFYFYTASTANSNQAVRIAVTGDCGTGTPAQTKMRDALMYYLNGKYIHCWMLLGDNAYYNGLDNEYTSSFFAPYQYNFIMHHTSLYPATGNHDYANSSFLAENKAVPYFDLFNCPTAGELGGIPSNTEAYYSYNYGNVHFISLDSYGTEQALRMWDTLSNQYQWLKQDLAANNSMWTIVYFHHSPFTMGSHNSDLESDLVNIRQYCTPVFEKYKVDIVMSGHSHNHERSWLMKGHRGMETTFNKSVHVKDTSSARYDGSTNSCPYIKDTISNEGVVYSVCGTSGWGGGGTQGTYPHNAMCYSNSTVGMAGYIEVQGNRLSAYFVGSDSVVHDKFTIFKNVKKSRTVWVTAGQNYTINASWNGNYVWNYNSQVTRQNVFAASTNTILIVRDSLNCIADTFHVQLGTGLIQNDIEELLIYPNPIGDEKIQLKGDNMSGIKAAELFSAEGKSLGKLNYYQSSDAITFSLPTLAGGIYFLKLSLKEGVILKKILVER